MSDHCEICRDPMTDDVCQTCGVRLCPRHRATWLGEDLRGLWCDACWQEMRIARESLPTPSRDEALVAMVDCLLTKRNALTKPVKDLLWGKGGHGSPGGIRYEYGFSVTYRDRKKVSVPKDSVIVERVHGTSCFEVFRYDELDQAVQERLNPSPPIPLQLEMFA